MDTLPTFKLPWNGFFKKGHGLVTGCRDTDGWWEIWDMGELVSRHPTLEDYRRAWAAYKEQHAEDFSKLLGPWIVRE